MNPIAIFYHGLFFLGEPPKPLTRATWIMAEQMGQLAESGLLHHSNELHVGINGGKESVKMGKLILPEKAQITYHGLQSRAENPTIVLLEEWVKTHPGWYVLYFHCKGATHPISTMEGKFSAQWRRGMMKHLVTDWRTCVADLEAGYDIACSTWMWGLTDGTHNIPAGNFLWVKSDFAAKLPSIFLRDRIKQDGIAAETSRHEAEVYWGFGPTPRVKSYRPEPWWWRNLNQ